MAEFFLEGCWNLLGFPRERSDVNRHFLQSIARLMYRISEMDFSHERLRSSAHEPPNYLDDLTCLLRYSFVS